jgi:hypothetical protein
MISETYKSIWVTPEECESKTISNILKTLGFNEFKGDLNDYQGFRVISTIKNPYHRLYDLYKKYRTNDVVIKKNMKEIVIKDFNFWVNLTFIDKKFLVEKYKLLDKDWVEYEHQPFISDCKFDKITPDYFVRLENLHEDLQSIDFLSNITLEDTHSENETYIDNIYEFNSAKKVFEYYKKIFYTAKYNPFSFKNYELSNSDKIKFIHNIF